MDSHVYQTKHPVKFRTTISFFFSTDFFFQPSVAWIRYDSTSLIDDRYEKCNYNTLVLFEKHTTIFKISSFPSQKISQKLYYC
jgi:hypothetical protein